MFYGISSFFGNLWLCCSSNPNGTSLKKCPGHRRISRGGQEGSQWIPEKPRRDREEKIKVEAGEEQKTRGEKVKSVQGKIKFNKVSKNES